MIKSAVRSLLGAAGFELRRVKPLQVRNFDIDNRSPAAGKVLEFIGPSGVGKSYLKKGVVDAMPLGWLQDHKVDWRLIEDKMRANVSSECQRVYGRICSNLSQNAFQCDLWYQQPDQVMRFLSFQMINIRKHLFLEGELSKGMVMDEGFVFVARNQIILELGENIENLASILKRRMLVVVDSSPPMIMQRIRKRLLERPDSPEYRGFSEVEILDSIERQKMEINSLLMAVEPYIGKVLHLNNEEKLEDNIQKISEFMSNV